MRSHEGARPALDSPLGSLVHGELSEADARELRQLNALIRRRSGFACDAYKEKCLRRRLAVRMRARGVHRYAEYAAILAEDPLEFDRFLTALTINVSKFFRNREVWDAIGERIVPELFELETSIVRIWSAGCAGGEEPYSMAIQLLEYARAQSLERRLRRFRILATDVDREILAAAKRAEYGDLSLEELPADLRKRWFESADEHRLAAEVRRLVRFEPLDLLTDPLPERQHLIFCRNVAIYFERHVQETLLGRLHDALVPGGILVLGQVEALLGPVARAFTPVVGRERIFRKVG